MVRLTKCERKHKLGKKLERCITKVKKKGSARNPFAVCRKAVSKKVC